MITLTKQNIFALAGGLSTKIPGWAKFAAAATPGARDEGMLIINSRLNACAKIARLNRLMSRWLDHERRSRPVSPLSPTSQPALDQEGRSRPGSPLSHHARALHI